MKINMYAYKCMMNSVSPTLSRGFLPIRRGGGSFQAMLTGLFCWAAGCVLAVDPDILGGVIVDQFNGTGQYVADPAIAVMPDGSYIATHSWFGSDGVPSGTKLFRSTNKGATWTLSSTSVGTKRSIFLRGSEIYLIGASTASIRRSVDNGVSWSSAVVLPGTGKDPATCVPHVLNNRVYLANGMRVISAPLDANLLSAASWTVSNEMPATPTGGTSWLGGQFKRWHEGQIVASPAHGVILMPNIEDLPNSALLRCNAAGTSLTFDPANDFVSLPGGDKKFCVFFDAVSNSYYALTNPILPEHGGYGTALNEDLIRNAAALYSSPDLRTWTLRSIFLCSPNRGGNEGEGGEAFQYLHAAIDGDDLVMVARTSLKDGSYSPPRGHDANLFTFHRLANFRNLPRRLVLLANTGANKVLKYERNLTERLAPLGAFTTTALNSPYGVTQTYDGDVFISEKTATGRVLQFSESGAFKKTVATAGTNFQGTPGALTSDGDSLFLATSANRVYRINPDTNGVTSLVGPAFGTPGGSVSLSAPLGLATDANGNLFVNDSGNDAIRKFNAATGAFVDDLLTNRETPQALCANLSEGRLLFSWQGGNHTNIGRVSLAGSVATLYNLSGLGTAYGILGLKDQVYWTDSNQGFLYRLTGTNARETLAGGLNAPSNLWALLPASTPLATYDFDGQNGSQPTTAVSTVRH